jgi:hypothetical protein
MVIIFSRDSTSFKSPGRSRPRWYTDFRPCVFRLCIIHLRRAYAVALLADYACLIQNFVVHSTSIYTLRT